MDTYEQVLIRLSKAYVKIVALEAERDALRADAERMAFLVDKSAQLIACPCEVGPEVMWAVCGKGVRALGWFASPRAAIDAAIAAKEPNRD